MRHHNLSIASVENILDYLDCPPEAPTLRYLNRLIHAYIRKVPWESVSRIIKRHTTPRTADCPRWPDEFWSEALKHGFGGTCFESNLAFYNLLTALGYEGYLTVNDMGSTRACHAASVILIKGQKYLVDITIPLHSAVRFDPGKTTRRVTPFHDYTIRPVRENTYEVDRSHHPNRNAFTLIDIPIRLSDYRSIVENDYMDKGFFLTSMVMAKVINERTWRFFSEHTPFRLESFNRQGKEEILLQQETLAHSLAERFQMPEGQISTALSLIQPQPNPYWVAYNSLQEGNRILT
jgi:arylamine N-acetyltransferase